MTQFATASELADRLGVEFTAAEEVRADALLTIASGLVQREARQTIEQVEDDSLSRPGTVASRFRLPERPVTEVASVTVDGELLDGDEWHVEGDEVVRTRVLGQDTFPVASSGGFGTPDESVVVVYTHGYATIPDAVKAVVLEVVARVWVNPAGVMQERLGAAQFTYLMQGTPTGLLLTSEERRTIRDLFRRTSGSVQLR